MSISNNSSSTLHSSIQSKNTNTLPQEIDEMSYLENGYNEDTKRFAQYKDIKTGFDDLDEQIGSLYPGLYVLGSMPSLGKTTFALQLADQLAASGEHVLFFSTVQSGNQLIAKSLARLTAKLNYSKTQSMSNTIPNAIFARDIMMGKKNTELEKAKHEYSKFASNILFLDDLDTSASSVSLNVEKYININQVKPVVIVDYLQILDALDGHFNTKEAVDYNLRHLKKLQSDYNLILLVISNINQSTYYKNIDLNSFKDSGIGDIADVLWGLQLRTISKEKFSEVMTATPRSMELVCLKNRFGLSDYTCEFNYYAQYDYFEANPLSSWRTRYYAQV